MAGHDGQDASEPANVKEIRYGVAAHYHIDHAGLDNELGEYPEFRAGLMNYLRVFMVSENGAVE